MTDIRLRILISATVLAMAVLYIGPFYVIRALDNVQLSLHQECMSEATVWSSAFFEFCWRRSSEKATLPAYVYFLPFAPAGLLIWVSWLIKIDSRIRWESFPTKIFRILIWLGLTVAAAGFFVTLLAVFQQDIEELHKLDFGVLWKPSYLASGCLAAPLVFHHLLAPRFVSESARKGQLGLIALASTPVIAFGVYAIREALRV